MAKARRGRGEGSIHERKNGLWEGKLSLGVSADGSRIRHTVYGNSKREVLDKLDELRAKASKGQLPTSKKERITLQTFLEHWLATEIKPSHAPATTQRYSVTLKNQVLPFLGGVLMGKLTALHIEKYYRDLEDAGHSSDARFKAGTLLRLAFKAAIRKGLLSTNYAEAVPLPKVEREEPCPLQESEATRFLQATKEHRLHALFVLALDSGARQGELFGLQWIDINWEKGTIFIRRSLEELGGQLRLKPPKTAKAVRELPIHQDTLAALKRHRELQEAERLEDSPTIFCDTEGKWLRKSNFIRRDFAPLLKKAGLNRRIGFHELRHTCATLLLSHGINIKIVSERLGHESIEVTLKIYSHVIDSMQSEAVKAIGDILYAMDKKTG